MSKYHFISIYYGTITTSILLAISSFSFLLFRFKPGIILKEWTLNVPENYDYLYSFSFKVWGVYLFIGSLFFISSIYTFLIYKDFIKKQKLWVSISLFWFIYAFAGLFDIPTEFFTFRIWTMFAFILSIFTAYGFLYFSDLSKKLGVPKIVVWLIFVILIFYTSGVQKYAVNTAIWPPGAFWTSNEELQGYIWFKDNIPAGTKVFTFSNNAVIIGLDKFTCHWCDDVREFQKKNFNSSSQETYNWLKTRGYEYIVIDGQTVKKFGINETNKKLQDITVFGKFLPTFQTQGFILMKIGS
jgi:hypothetical protein